MPAQQSPDSRTYWQQFWSSAISLSPDQAEPRDVWYAVDEAKFRHLLPHLPHGGRSLEVGCGSARSSRFLAAYGFQVAGLDYDVAAVQLAGRQFRSAGVRGDVLLGDAFVLPFADQSFDVVLSTGLLEHFPDPFPIVAEMARVLRCGGLFYSDIVPKKFSLLRALDFLRIRGTDLWERPFTREEIVVLLRNAGLSGITVFPAGIFPPFLPLLQRWRLIDRLHRRLAALFQRMAPRLDGTKAAELLGLYYFACAQKPQPLRDSAAGGDYAGIGHRAQSDRETGQHAGSVQR